MGLMVEPGNAQLVVQWTAVTNATGYEVQWKSGGESYNTSGRQATIGSGSTTSHTISSLSNGTEYTVQVRATRTGANNGAYSAEVLETPVMPTAAGVTVSKSALTVTEQDIHRGHLHGGPRSPADGKCDGDGQRGHGEHGRDRRPRPA